MNVVDDLFRLKTSGVPLTNLEAKFFRYHQYHLLDRLINYQLAVQFSIAKGKNIELAEIGVSQYLAQRIQSNQAPSCIRNATSHARNLIREIQN